MPETVSMQPDVTVLIPARNREGHIGRAPNVSHIETYIARLDEMIRRKRELFLESPSAF